jgi:hypothetical protein
MMCLEGRMLLGREARCAAAKELRPTPPAALCGRRSAFLGGAAWLGARRCHGKTGAWTALLGPSDHNKAHKYDLGYGIINILMNFRAVTREYPA